MELLDPIPADDPGAISWWQEDVASCPLAPKCPPLAGRVDTDVAIVGGGFTALWTALTLRTRAPHLRVAILEAYRCGAGASSRAGGNVHGYWGALSTLVDIFGADAALEAAALGTAAQEKLSLFARGRGRDVWWVEDGYLRVATSITQATKLKSFIEIAERLGASNTVHLLSDREVRAVCHSPRFVGGLHFTEGATVHPARLAEALRQAALDAGVTIFETSAVRTIRQGSPNLLVTKHGEMTARDVVLANYTGTMVVPEVAKANTLFSSFPVMSAPNEPELTRMNYTAARGIADLRMFTHYFRRTRDGRVMMGSGSGPIAFGHDHAALKLRVDAASTKRAELGLQRFFPRVASNGIVSRWGWPIEVASDRLPFFGTISGTRIRFGSGYSGHGINATCIAGECLASLVLDVKDRWSSSPFCRRRQLQFPPEPLRFVGGTMIRNAIVACEDAEEAGQRASLAERCVSAIPRLLRMRIGMR